jgi:hypothetical protein
MVIWYIFSVWYIVPSIIWQPRVGEPSQAKTGRAKGRKENALSADKQKKEEATKIKAHTKDKRLGFLSHSDW